MFKKRGLEIKERCAMNWEKERCSELVSAAHLDAHQALAFPPLVGAL